MPQIGQRKGTKVSGAFKNVLVSAAVTSVTIDGLDGNADGGYEIGFNIVNSSGIAQNFSLYANNDQTVTNYARTWVYGGNAIVATAAYANDALIASVINGNDVWVYGNITIINGYIRATMLWGRSNDVLISSASWIKIALIGNLNRLDIVASGANGIGASSRFRLWKKL